jgi:hypothetical protein
MVLPPFSLLVILWHITTHRRMCLSETPLRELPQTERLSHGRSRSAWFWISPYPVSFEAFLDDQ